MVQTLVMGMKSLLYSLSSFGNTHQVLSAFMACVCLFGQTVGYMQHTWQKLRAFG